MDPVSRLKPISGQVVSSKPISLPKAAKILSKFVTVENGASHAISAYLQRASTAFDELVHLHKELKAPKSERKSMHRELDFTKELPQETELSVAPRQTVADDVSEEPSHGDHESFGGDRKKEKKSKKKKVDTDHTGNLGGNDGNVIDRATKGDSHLASEVLDEVFGNLSNAGVAGEKKKNKKQQQNWKDEKGNLVENGMEDGVRNDGTVIAVDKAKKKAGESNEGEEKGGEASSEQSSKKKKKRKGGDGSSLQDNGVVATERESSKKKREREEIEEGQVEDGLMERPNKKSKKRKNSDEH